MQHDESREARNDTAHAVRGMPHPSRDIPRLERLRTIVKDHQACRMEGMMVDAFTASMLVQVYDALSADNRAKLDAMPLRKAVDLCWGLCK